MAALSSTSLQVSTKSAFTGSCATGELRTADQFDVPRSRPGETEAPGVFELELSRWTFGEFVFTRTLYANADARHCRHEQRSFLGHWRVTLAHSGTEGLASLCLANAHQGCLGFCSLAIPFEGKAEDTEVLALYLPRNFRGDELDDAERVYDLDIQPELGALLAGYMKNLSRLLPHMPPDHAEALATATGSVVAACITRRAERPEAAEIPLSSLLIDRARHVVRQNMASPEFGPEQLARLMAMSRSKLYRFLESTGGVAHFINRERLREAHRRLNSPRDALSIHVIGNEVGFTDHSTFSRAFRREFGYSPTEARERSLVRFSGQPLGLALRNATPD